MSMHKHHQAVTTVLAAAALLAACATPDATPGATTPAAAPMPVSAAGTAATPRPGSTSAPPSVQTSAPTTAPTATPAAARPPLPLGSPPAFADVTRDAKRSDGFLPVWTKDDRTWLEIPADQLGKPFFLGSSLASGLGEARMWPGLMGREQVVVLRRVGNNVQLQARNLHARAPAGTPLARAVGESYSDSLLAWAPLAAAPQAQNKALLVDAFTLFGNDIGALQTQLEASFRLPYTLDRSNSSIDAARTNSNGTYLTVRQHFAITRLPAPPLPPAPGATPPNPGAQPNISRTLADPRSLFLNMAYTLAPLPAQPMQTRRADQRVGYFTSSYVDFGNDRSDGRRVHLIERWRLEKKDPAAAVSEPKEPIRVVMDRNIPEKWREPVRAGVLEWNRAFERAGFRNALTVEQQAEDAEGSSLEGTRMLAVRWFAQEGPGSTAVGPSQSDARTGELLRGAVIIDENRVRIFRASTQDTQPRLTDTLPSPANQADHGGHAYCTHAEDTFDEAAMGFELLSLRGAVDPEGPEAERFIAAALRNVTMHEVGHAIGLRHNFRASGGVTAAQLRDPAYTARNGVSNSVMEYNAVNLPLDSETVADYFSPTLGPYDYWAIEYGYRQFANADEEKAGLARLMAMSETDPALAYATDEDAQGTDPMVNQRDMGNDPLAFAQRQFKLTRELWARTQKRELPADDDMTVLRRNLQRGFGNMAQALPWVTKYVGGTYTSRTLAGSGKPLFQPVPAARQREALDVVVAEIFSSASFKFEPRFMARLGIDRNERERGTALEFSLPATVLALHRGALDSLMTDALAARLADAEARVDDPRTLLSYAEVQERLSAAIWSELGTAKGGGGGKVSDKVSDKAGDIDSLRRNLQREHLRRLAAGLLRPASAAAADVRSVHRSAAVQLRTRLTAALAAGGWSSLVRSHLEDSLATVDESLKASLVKQGV